MRSSLFALLALSAFACAAPKPEAPSLRGISLPAPIAKPDFTLTSTDGQPFDFRARTSGKLTLLFFGYLNCPDVCPVHASNLSTVIQKLTGEDRQRLTFVFVTTDPDRDTLPALRKWLKNFDASFVGLRGSADSVNGIMRQLNLADAVAGERRPDGSYGVGHASQVIAFEADDSARVVYPFGTRQEDWAADIPKLLARRAR